MTTRYIHDLQAVTLKAWLVNFPDVAAGSVADMASVWWYDKTSQVWTSPPDPKTRDATYVTEGSVSLTATDLRAREQQFWEGYSPTARTVEGG